MRNLFSERVFEVDYVIQYGEGGACARNTVNKKKPFGFYRIVIAAVCVLLLIVGRKAVMRALVPGDSAVTVAAVQGMVSDLREGIGFRDAFFAFCREILYGAH